MEVDLLSLLCPIRVGFSSSGSSPSLIRDFLLLPSDSLLTSSPPISNDILTTSPFEDGLGRTRNCKYTTSSSSLSPCINPSKSDRTLANRLLYLRIIFFAPFISFIALRMGAGVRLASLGNLGFALRISYNSFISNLNIISIGDVAIVAVYEITAMNNAMMENVVEDASLDAAANSIDVVSISKNANFPLNGTIIEVLATDTAGGGRKDKVSLSLARSVLVFGVRL
mmetsp:Transcript_26688/g.42337  ORF Transcript_26688/g.42337 Transcript_26688/m.42337 type:complete len:226 (+) Transcript_26688:1036-1713(+)